jgi:hypothetical protein
MPYQGITQRHYWSSLISQDCQDWLNENVGPGTLDYRQWILAHDTNEYQWCYAGLDHGPLDMAVYRIFHIRDASKATLFKLTWSGEDLGS